MTIKKYSQNVGRHFLEFLRYLGGMFLLTLKTTIFVFVPPLKGRLIFIQMKKIGIDSFPIVCLISFFTGVVLALQSAYQLQKISAQLYIASLVALSVIRELGPVLTGLAVAGRMGAAITAELGTMKVTEQIDALETLSANPIKYLVVPRFLAMLVMLPILTIYADVIGMIGGYIIGVYKLGIGSNVYIKMTTDALVFKDLYTGLFKSVVFGIVIVISACYEGLMTGGGAEGVGKATTRSVVMSFILIISADCFFTALFYFIFM